jgi:hypothetical protein
VTGLITGAGKTAAGLVYFVGCREEYSAHHKVAYVSSMIQRFEIRCSGHDATGDARKCPWAEAPTNVEFWGGS